jgi:3-oxoacyl-[acyl-carrier-protein] synthase II
MVDRYAFGGDATHLTGSDPDGSTLRRLITHTADGRPVDLVHAHGTGTDTNDPLELAAIQASVPDSSPRPVLYSHKGALGHSLGSAGLVATAINWLIHRTGNVPGNIRTTNPLASPQLTLSAKVVHRRVARSLMIASGFGGAMACVSLRDA